MTRWMVIVALLGTGARESRRLSRLLEHLPAERHRHLIADDVRRRLWLAQARSDLNGGAQVVDSAEGCGSFPEGPHAGDSRPGLALASERPQRHSTT